MFFFPYGWVVCTCSCGVSCSVVYSHNSDTWHRSSLAVVIFQTLFLSSFFRLSCRHFSDSPLLYHCLCAAISFPSFLDIVIFIYHAPFDAFTAKEPQNTKELSREKRQLDQVTATPFPPNLTPFPRLPTRHSLPFPLPLPPSSRAFSPSPLPSPLHITTSVLPLPTSLFPNTHARRIVFPLLSGDFYNPWYFLSSLYPLPLLLAPPHFPPPASRNTAAKIQQRCVPPACDLFAFSPFAFFVFIIFSPCFLHSRPPFIPFLLPVSSCTPFHPFFFLVSSCTSPYQRYHYQNHGYLAS